MPATSLRCRSCGHELGLDAVGACEKCWGPLEPVYDLRRAPPTASPASGSQPARPRSGATERSCRWRPPAEPRLAARPDAARRGAPARRGDRPARALPQAGHGEPHALVQGSRRRGRVREGAGARAHGRWRARRPATSAAAVAARAAVEGLEAAVFCPAGLEREKLLPTAAYGATIYEVLGSYDDCSRLTVELSFELPLGVRERRPARLLRRGLEDARVRDRRAARLAAPGRRRLPGRLRSAVLEAGKGIRRVRRARARRGSAAAARSAPRRRDAIRSRRRYREERPVTPVRPQTAGQLARDRQPRRRRPRVATARASGGSIHSVPEDEIGTNMALLAESSGVFGEAAAGICLGALREAISARERSRQTTASSSRHRRRPEDARAPWPTASRRSRSRRMPTRCSSSSGSRCNFTFYMLRG